MHFFSPDIIKTLFSINIVSQIIGWLIFFIIQFSLAIYRSGEPADYSGIFWYKSLFSLTGFGLVQVLVQFYVHYIGRIRKIIWRVLSFIVSAYAMAIAYVAISSVLSFWVWKEETLNLQWSQYFLQVLNWQIWFILCFSGLYFITNYASELNIQKEKTFKANALAQQAQLKMLRYQLNPHFLFNALNTIRAMVIKDQEKARHMITELSDFIRYALVDDELEMVPISKEMEMIHNYLSIQKIRFAEKLEVEIQIDLNTEDIKIPCYLIHPLVENAIKYGIQTSSKPLRLKINIFQTSSTLIIQVLNTGKLIVSNDKNGTGTGLKNIQARLMQLYPDAHRFDLDQQDGWVQAVIEVDVKL